jgi:hypothetical protein
MAMGSLHLSGIILRANTVMEYEVRGQGHDREPSADFIATGSFFTEIVT